MVRPDDGKTFDGEELVEGDGFLMEPGTGHTASFEDRGEGAPDDMVEDPLNDEGVPGTVDDLPYDYGVEIPTAADQELHVSRDSGWGGVGRTGADAEGTESELGTQDERELWSKQRLLIEGSENEEARGLDLSDAEVARAEDALGEDAAEALPMNPDGVSAGSGPDEPEHGGFPGPKE
jgi:hypothetical protein